MTELTFNTPIWHNVPKKIDHKTASKLAPVSKRGILNTKFSLIGKINEIVDDYFSFSSTVHIKTDFYEGNKRVITPVKIKRSVFGCILKVASYFTIILPIYMIFHKLIYRISVKVTVRPHSQLSEFLKKKPTEAPLKPLFKLPVKRTDSVVHENVLPSNTFCSFPKGVKHTEQGHPLQSCYKTFDINEFSPKSPNLKLDTKIGLKKKPKALTLDFDKISQKYQALDLLKVAKSLGIDETLSNGCKNEVYKNLNWLQNEVENKWSQFIQLEESRLYIRRILEIFDTTDIQNDKKKDVITKIGEGCGPSTCYTGTMNRLRKVCANLEGAGEDDVEQIFLRELDDLKLERLNVMVPDYTQPHWRWGTHFIAAAQVHLADELGLNKEAGKKDRHYNKWKSTRGFDTPSKKEQFVKHFLKGYTHDLIIGYVGGKINGNVGTDGIPIHIGACNTFIKDILKRDFFPMPKTLEELQNGPLNKHLKEAFLGLKESQLPNLKGRYEEALNFFIREHFIEYVEDEESFLEVPKKLKDEGVVFILKNINIIC